MPDIVEFSVCEVITASINQRAAGPGAEAYTDPTHIGFYKNGGGEIFIEQGSSTVQISSEYLADFVKQLKRANKMALEVEATNDQS